MKLTTEKQFEALFKENWQQMYLAGYTRLPDHQIVEDMIQEIFIDIWKRREEIQFDKDPKIYLLTAVKYQVLKHLDRSISFASLTDNSECGQISDEADILSLDEVFEKIEVAVDKLSPRSAEIFKLSKFEGKSVDEIAQGLQISPQTVHNSLSSSLKILRRELGSLGAVLIFCLS